MAINTIYCGIWSCIAYHINAMGPSIAVNAAYDGLLVVMHHSWSAIIAGEPRAAIVGGANTLCGPWLTRMFDKAGQVL